jgi:hypothetical protein
MGFPIISDFRVVNNVDFCISNNGLYMVELEFSSTTEYLIKYF